MPASDACMHNNTPSTFSRLTHSLSFSVLARSTAVHLFTSSPYLKVPGSLCSARKMEWFNQWDRGERGRNRQRLDHCTDVSDVMRLAHNSIRMRRPSLFSTSLYSRKAGEQVKRKAKMSMKPQTTCFTLGMQSAARSTSDNTFRLWQEEREMGVN